MAFLNFFGNSISETSEMSTVSMTERDVEE